ncbi:MAG: MFS transporter [Aeromonas sp.]|uniref:MFS transporter n=1 Tax=Aeromonas sp. TaxID=647 RepID=UPI003F414F73
MQGMRFSVFLGSRLLSGLGDQILQFAVPLLVYRSTGSVALSGLAFFIEWLPRLVSLPLAGVFADRVGGRRVYILADGLRAAACVVTALIMTLWPGSGLAPILLMMALCAFCYAQAFIALETTLPQLVPQSEMAKAQSWLQLTNNGASVLGPALAAALLIWMPATQLLWGCALGFALSATGVLGLTRGASLVPAAGRRALLPELREGLGALLAQPTLLRLVGLAMLVNLIVGLALATAAPMTLGLFGQSDQTLASVQLTMGIISIAAFLLMPWLLRRFSVYWIGQLAFLLILAGGLIMARAPSFGWYLLGCGLSYGLCGLFNVFIRTERLHWIAEQQRGRVISLMVLLNQLSLPLAGLIVALFGSWVPVQEIFLVASLVSALGYLLLYRALAGAARTRTPPQPAPSAVEAGNK